MKKILEVLQYGEHDIRFNTDIDVRKNPQVVGDLIPKVAMAMGTSLWGGNETSVLAVIRVLCLADLALSVNRKEMIQALDRDSEYVLRMLKEAKDAITRSGGKVQVFGPGVGPSGCKS